MIAAGESQISCNSCETCIRLLVRALNTSVDCKTSSLDTELPLPDICTQGGFAAASNGRVISGMHGSRGGRQVQGVCSMWCCVLEEPGGRGGLAARCNAPEMNRVP